MHLLEEEARRVQKRGSKLRLFPLALYAGLPAASQQQVFEPTPRGYRKVGPTSHPPSPLILLLCYP